MSLKIEKHFAISDGEFAGGMGFGLRIFVRTLLLSIRNLAPNICKNTGVSKCSRNSRAQSREKRTIRNATDS